MILTFKIKLIMIKLYKIQKNELIFNEKSVNFIIQFNFYSF